MLQILIIACILEALPSSKSRRVESNVTHSCSSLRYGPSLSFYRLEIDQGSSILGDFWSRTVWVTLHQSAVLHQTLNTWKTSHEFSSTHWLGSSLVTCQIARFLNNGAPAKLRFYCLKRETSATFAVRNAKWYAKISTSARIELIFHSFCKRWLTRCTTKTPILTTLSAKEGTDLSANSDTHYCLMSVVSKLLNEWPCTGLTEHCRPIGCQATKDNPNPWISSSWRQYTSARQQSCILEIMKGQPPGDSTSVARCYTRLDATMTKLRITRRSDYTTRIHSSAALELTSEPLGIIEICSNLT